MQKITVQLLMTKNHIIP